MNPTDPTEEQLKNRLQATGQAPTKQVSVIRTQDNPDGTTTNFLSDGSTDTGNYNKNPDGSLNFVPTSSKVATPEITTQVSQPIATTIASPEPAPQASQPVSQPQTTPQPYTGNSLEDFLVLKGLPSDKQSRAKLAVEQGLVKSTQDYLSLASTGQNANINTQILNRLKTSQPIQQPQAPKQTPVETPKQTPTETPKETPAPEDTRTDIQRAVAEYSQAYEEYGLPTVKTKIEEILKEQNDLQEELNTKIDDLNNNPWISSSSRSERTEKLKTQYESKLNNLTNLHKLFSNLYEQGQEEVKTIMSNVRTDREKALQLAQKIQESKDALLNDNIVVDDGVRQKLVSKIDGSFVADLGASKKTSGEASTGGGTGSVTRDADSILAGNLNLQDISVAGNYRAKVAGELTNRLKQAEKSGDLSSVMKASAVYDKEPSDTFLQSMEKTLSVVSQLGGLQQSIQDEKTGPLVGAFRSKNPWDTKAQVIKAQLNAIVPNLARGVYGEVGVLTDNDIKQYAKTIPTLTSTEDIRNAILYITLDQIKKNVEIKIKNQAAGQRDMSGYAQVYDALNEQVNQILSTLPKGTGGQTTTTRQPFTGSSGKTYTLPSYIK